MKIARGFMLIVLLTVLMFPAVSNCDVSLGKEMVIESGKTVKDAISIGSNVRVYGTVKKDAVSLGGDVIVESGGKIKGDAVSIGGDIIIKDDGEVRKDAVSIGGSVNVSYRGTVHGDCIKMNKFTPGLMFKRVFPHSLGNISQAIAKTVLIGPFIGIFGAAGFIISMVFLLIKLTVSFAIAALVTYFFPQQVSRMANYAQEDFPKALLLGIMILIVIPIMLLFLLSTLIGIPLIPLVLVTLFIIRLFGSVGIALWVGRIIPESEGRSLMVNVLLGVLTIGILKHIPIIGVIVWIGVWAASYGIVILTQFAVRSRGVAP